MNAPRLWALLAAGVAAFLGVDAQLVRTGRESASCWMKRHPAVLVGVSAALWYLPFHFAGRPKRLARYDPLHRAAQWLARTP